MADKKQRLVIDSLRGGRYSAKPAWAISETQCAAAMNVDWYQSQFGRKRAGMVDPTTSGSPFGATHVGALYRHVPGTSEGDAELWAIGGAVIGRLAGGTAWATITPEDTRTGNSWDASFASCDGKLFMTAQTDEDRLYCWDGTQLRRTGLEEPDVPAASNAGGIGAYPAILRYYRVRWAVYDGGILTRLSEPSPSVAFTPGGATAYVGVDRPGTGGGVDSTITHWWVEVSLDDVTFYVLYGDGGQAAAVAIATTQAADGAATTSYADYDVAYLTGMFTTQKAYKFIAADSGRLIGFGSFTATNRQNDLEFSPVLGSLDIGDVERVDTSVNYRITLDEVDSGFATGLCGPVEGSFFAFKDRQTFRLVPTGNVDQPYRVECLSKSVGAIFHRAVEKGEDAQGNACVYWMSHRGPYRYGIFGLEYIGGPIEDFIATINLAGNPPAHTLYYPDKRQVWFWVKTTDPVSSETDTSTRLFIYDIVLGAWSECIGRIQHTLTSCLFSDTLGASMSRYLKPFVGQFKDVNRIWKCDTGTDDVGTPYQAYITTRAFEPGGPGFFGELGDAVLMAASGSGVTITATIIRDFAVESRTASALLTPIGSETRVQRRLSDSAYGQCQFVQYTIGDGSAVSNSWNLDRLIVSYQAQDALAT